MKRTLYTVCIIAIAMFATPQQANAQFLKKLQKAAKSVMKEPANTTTEKKTAEEKTIKLVESASGVKIGNPASNHFDVEFISAEGDKASNIVTIYVKATTKSLNYSEAKIGGRFEERATDTNGNEYKSDLYTKGRTMTVDIPAKFEAARFKNVPATITSFPVVYLSWYLDSSNSCPSGTNYLNHAIQLRNVPITWK